MARKEKRAIRKYDKLGSKIDKTDSDRRKERLTRRRERAQATVDRISEAGTKYYSLSDKERKKVDRGYAWAKTGAIMRANADGYDRNREIRAAEYKAMTRIDEYSRRKRNS